MPRDAKLKISEEKVFECKINPMGKPRMTQRDKWLERDCTSRYWAFKANVVKKAEELGFTMPASEYHIIFRLPMPRSWSKKKRSSMDGAPHQTKPDKDNLEKAFLDALCKDDSFIWDGRVSKFWSNDGCIEVYLNSERGER